MKKTALQIIIMLLLSSCASVKISADYDQNASFESYKTYALVVYPESLPYDRDMSTTAILSVERELKSKGLKKAENADLLVDMKARATQAKTVSGTSTGEYPDFYGVGYIYTWGAGFSTATINFNSYSEGTLFIDLIDARKRQLVWQGRGMTTLRPDAPPTEREKNLSEAITKIMSKYPPEK